MKPLPANPLRRNRGTWAVPPCHLPAVAAVMLDALPREGFDPAFQGQRLATTYLDTPSFALRKARHKGDRYLTLRVRCYRRVGRDSVAAAEGGEGDEVYALSAKTEQRKWRQEIPPDAADLLLYGGPLPVEATAAWLPADLLARLQELAGDQPLAPVVTVCSTRYAVEDQEDRLTLDVAVSTDTGLVLPYNVLEFKSRAVSGARPPAGLDGLGLRPVKSSKFLWATGV